MALCVALGPWLAMPHAMAQSSAQPRTLPAKAFAGSGIETSAPRPATAAWLPHLPARIEVPNAQQRVVGTPVGGLVTSVVVGPGESVRAGQALARVQSPELLGLQRELAQARSERERTARILQRDEALLAEGLIPASRVENARAADRQAAALLAEKRALLALTGTREGGAGEFTVVAPIAGVVLEQNVRTGERVEPAAAMFRVARLDPLALQIDVPVLLAQGISAGTAVRIPATGSTGSVIAVGRSVAASQTVVVRARLDSGISALSPGQQVEADIEVRPGTRRAALWQVPATSIVRLDRGDETMAFVERGDVYVAIPVQVVGEADGGLVVTGDLRETDRIVARGASQLKSAIERAAEAR